MRLSADLVNFRQLFAKVPHKVPHGFKLSFIILNVYDITPHVFKLYYWWCNIELKKFTPHSNNNYMSVVQKDRVVHGMLQDELERCEGLSRSLDEAISRLPKGSLHERKIPSGKKHRSYYYLKFREGHKSVYKHVPKRLQPELAAGIDERRKLERQLHQIKSRIRYLRKLLSTGADK